MGQGGEPGPMRAQQPSLVHVGIGEPVRVPLCPTREDEPWTSAYVTYFPSFKMENPSFVPSLAQ